jgi:hypothetical protein
VYVAYALAEPLDDHAGSEHRGEGEAEIFA